MCLLQDPGGQAPVSICCRMRAVSCPFMVRMRYSGMLYDLKPCWKQLGGIDPDRVQTRDESRALDGGNNGRYAVQIYYLLYATDEAAADDAFIDERLTHLQT